MVTSEELTGFAFMAVTKCELASGLKNRKCIIGVPRTIAHSNTVWQKSGVRKTFTSADVPTPELSFLVTRIPGEKLTQDIGDEMVQIGELRQEPQRK